MKPLLLMLALSTLCSATEPQAGSPAPELKFSQVLQAPPTIKAEWSSLKGTSVVLEFWATWCPGCRDQIPHLNRLAEQFKGKPVQFISVTDEEPGIVERFLKDIPILGWVALDSAGSTFKNFGVIGRPEAVLVDANGAVRASGPSTGLTSQLLEDFLDGRPVALSTSAPVRLQSLPEPLFEMMIRPAAPSDVVGYSPGAEAGTPGRSSEGWGFTLRSLLSTAFDVPEERISAPRWAGGMRYDFSVADPNLTPGRESELLLQAMESTFQLKAHKEQRETDVYVLRRIPGVAPLVRPTATETARGYWAGKPGDRKAVSEPMTVLTDVASRILLKPVIDETNLKGKFDFELKWEPGNSDSLIHAVASQLGLEIIQAQRPLDYLIVDSAVQPKAW